MGVIRDRWDPLTPVRTRSNDIPIAVDNVEADRMPPSTFIVTPGFKAIPNSSSIKVSSPKESDGQHIIGRGEHETSRTPIESKHNRVAITQKICE
mmetsp:Transcript_13283/g.26674  ORF Transcript_13283/g.26674 Transcript_13283/m.26674 type:complete len:95 (-) Transcript_13283:312-596(-)